MTNQEIWRSLSKPNYSKLLFALNYYLNFYLLFIKTKLVDLNKLVFAHLNINSIRNKFKLLSEQVRGNAHVLMVSETKIDDSFPIF